MMTSHGLDIEDDDAPKREVQPAALPGPPAGAQVLVVVRMDSVYSNTLLEVTLVSSVVFVFTTAAHIVQVTLGRQEAPGTLKAIEKDGAYRAQFQTFDWLRELETSAPKDVQGPMRTYGMRFFPFVASELRCDMKCSLPIAYTVIDVPDMYRFVWYSLEAYAGDTNISSGVTIRHSYSIERSRYVLEWPQAAQREHAFKWKVRAGGLFFLRAISLPMYYGVIAMVGIATASFQSHALALGAVVAGWIFLLRHWVSLNPPQRHTLLGELYLVAGLMLGAWGVAWSFVSWYALIGLAIIGPFALLMRHEARHFQLSAELQYLDRWWARRVLQADAGQDAFLLARRSPAQGSTEQGHLASAVSSPPLEESTAEKHHESKG